MHYLKIIAILFVLLISTEGKSYFHGNVLKIKWESGKSIIKNNKEFVSILICYDVPSYQLKSTIYGNRGIQSEFDLIDISTSQNGLEANENWKYLLMFRFNERIFCAKYCVDSSIVTIESITYNKSSRLNTFKGTMEGNTSELNIDSLRNVIHYIGDKSKYRLISLRDTLILSPAENDSIRYIHFSSYGDGVCDELSDSILQMNLLDGYHGIYKRPVEWKDCGNRDIDLQWKESGFFIYYPGSRKFGMAGKDSSDFDIVEKVENGVITFSGVKKNRDGVRARNVARWDSKRQLLIFYEFWPEVVFYPHAYKIDDDLLKLFTKP